MGLQTRRTLVKTSTLRTMSACCTTEALLDQQQPSPQICSRHAGAVHLDTRANAGDSLRDKKLTICTTGCDGAAVNVCRNVRILAAPRGHGRPEAIVKS